MNLGDGVSGSKNREPISTYNLFKCVKNEP